jgi:hypothetical protein
MTSRATWPAMVSNACDPAALRKPRAAVGVDVGDHLFPQLLRVMLTPFGRAEQRRLLGVPRAEHDRALRLPAGGRAQLGESACFIEHRSESAHRIAGADDPGIVMVAAHDPFVGKFLADEPGNHVVSRHQIPIELEFEPDDRPSGAADAIGER